MRVREREMMREEVREREMMREEVREMTDYQVLERKINEEERERERGRIKPI